MNKLRKHSSKGFTLVELIVVIVIIAILVAALTPAILSVIERANISADESAARTMITIASVAGAGKKPAPGTPLASEVVIEANGVGGGNNLAPGTYVIYFQGPVAIGCQISNAQSNKSKVTPVAWATGVTVGGNNITTVPGIVNPITVTVAAGGLASSS